MSFKSKLKLSALALSIGMACSAQAAYNPQFTDVISFGDSLSDMGAMKGLNDASLIKGTGMELGNFTTPGGSTASGHLANNYGKTSKAALVAKIDETALNAANKQVLGSIGSLQTVTEIASGMADGLLNVDKVKESSADQAALASIKTIAAKLDTITDNKGDPTAKITEGHEQNGKVLLGELQRLTLLMLVKHGKEAGVDISNLIQYEEDKDGNNFAIGGASAVSTANGATFPLEAMGISLNTPLLQKSLKDQVDTYLNRDGKADPNALYTITAGANDLFRASSIKAIAEAGGNKAANEAGAAKMLELIGKGITDPAEIKKQAEAAGAAVVEQQITKIVTDAATAVATQTKRLVAAGAKFVVVTNMPDITDTPSFEQTKQQILATARQTATAEASKKAKTTLTEKELQQIGDKAEAKALVTTVAAAQAESQAAVNGFNDMLKASLGNTPVIYTDINGFLKTVKADPNKFGFDSVNTKLTFCGNSSVICTPKAQKLKDALTKIDDDKSTSAVEKKAAKQALLKEAAKDYIFADGVHPSSALHKYLADVVTNGYLRSPGYNASMQSLARSGQNELAELFEGRRTALVANPLAEGEFRPYVNISGSHRDGAKHDNLAKGKVDSVRLYVAMDYGISYKVSGGLMLTVQHDKQDFTKDMYGKQEREAYIAGAYLNRQVSDHWTVGFNGYVGKGDYDQTRRYTIGDGTNTNAIVQVNNTSETDSIMVGGSFGANGHYVMSDIDLMPRVNLNYQYEKINGYTEKTDTAGAVKFDDATLKRTELALGLNVSKTFDVSGMALKPFADLDWRQQLAGDKEQTVKWKTAADNGAYTDVNVAETDRSFGTVKVGGQLEVTEGLTTQLSYSKKFGSSLSNGDRIMLDVGYTF